jgi:vanillate O-demethylase ferredoxin subunit
MNAPLPLDVAREDGVLELQVRVIRLQAQGICSYELAHPSGEPLPSFAAGAHIDVHLPGGLVRSYSLAGDPQDRSQWLLGVLKEPQGQGGSRAMHEQVRVGDLLRVGPVRNAFPLAAAARRTVLIGGGIGITPLKAMAHTLSARGDDFELHYCARSPAHAAFLNDLRAIVPPGRLHLHFDGGDPARGLDIQALLKDCAEGTHVYFCGPAGFMQACEAASAHWPPEAVHNEHFKAPAAAPSDVPDGGFELRLVRSGVTIQVGPDQTIVRAIELSGRRVPTSCLSGLCGACKVDYLEGEVDHRDYILDDAERARCLTVCVSRARSRTLSLDL